MVMLPHARPPEGMRIYAIGDVHGCLDPLLRLHEAIERDLARRPVADWRMIHVGDYVDRGPQSREVIDHLAGLAAGEPRVVALRGNHDQYFVDFIDDPDSPDFGHWMTLGGAETLASYGFHVAFGATPGREAQRALHARLLDALPEEHATFLRGLEHVRVLGDFAFVHAGIRPGLAIEDQHPQDLLWIRQPFLSHDADLGHVVVHGHTPVRAVQVRLNRIGIDTGAVFGGVLSCLVLEGPERGLLGSGGVEPLP